MTYGWKEERTGLSERIKKDPSKEETILAEASLQTDRMERLKKEKTEGGTKGGNGSWM